MGTVVPRLEKVQRVNEQRACGYSFLQGRRGPPLYHLLRHDACVQQTPHACPPLHARSPHHAFNASRGEAQQAEELLR